jgi:molecular chaperone GrpE
MKNHKKHHHEEKKEELPKGATVEVSAEEYEGLKKRVAELEGLKEKFLHAAADFENAKKRNARDKEEFIKFTQEKILADLLPALDNFERAINHATALSIPDADEETLRQNFKSLTSGVQMVQKQILDVLKNYGLVRLQTIGEKFDPHFHEVVGYVTEDGDEDRIVDELSAGYKLHDRLLRAAKVRIRVSPERREASQEKEDEIT